MFRNPRPSRSDIERLYTEAYYTGKADYYYHDERESERHSRHVWDRRIAVLCRYAKRGAILDVGSAFGGLLRAAREQYSPYGIELSAYSGSQARSEFGDTIHIGTLDDHPFPHDHFSAITMIELLEHLPDPIIALRECFMLLRTNGILVIQTANMAGLQARIQGDRYAYFMPGHLSYFTKKNLTAALLRCGFRRVKVFHPVEFGLLPKLKKSRGSFRGLLDYRIWARISLYHWMSKLRFGDFAATSSMVIYAFK